MFIKTGIMVNLACFACVPIEQQNSKAIEKKKLRVDTETSVSNLITYNWQGDQVLITGHLYGEINIWSMNYEEELELLCRFGTHPNKIINLTIVNMVVAIPK